MIEATGTASGGQSTAAATVTASLAENGGTTAVTLTTNLTITGKPAQFGRGMIEDVRPLGYQRTRGGRCGPRRRSPGWLPAKPPATEEIDRLDAASGAVAKRVMPAITALAVLALLIRRWRRRC